MEIHEKHLEDLKEIRSIMERSSRFISLSGLSGVFAGIYAIAGASAVWLYTRNNGLIRYILNTDYFSYGRALNNPDARNKLILFLFTDALIVLTLALATGIFLTTRQARKNKQSIWDNSSKRMIINLAIPLATGGLFSLALLYHGFIGFIAPAMLIFYGLALINGSKYTLTDIRYLGFCEIVLGLIAMFYIGYGILFWTIGFGVLHILYGTIMYYKYER